jgi:hypothetical protein
MLPFFRSKFSSILIFLFILSITVPLTFISFRFQETYAAPPSTHSKVYHASQTPHHSSVKFDSTISDWPEYHGDAARDGTASSNTFFSNINANTLTPVAGPGFAITNAAMSSPAIYQGVVYYTSNAPVTTVVAGVTQTLDTSTTVPLTTQEVK